MNNNFAKVEEIIVDLDELQTPGSEVFKRSGEHRLLVAILERAILDLVNYDEKLSSSAEEWFDEPYREFPDRMEVNSFQYICSQLDFDYFNLKSKILRYKAECEVKRLSE